MKTFTFLLAATAMMTVAASAQSVPAPFSSSEMKMERENLTSQSLTPAQRAQSMTMLAKKSAAGPMRSVAAPGDYELIEPSEGAEYTYVKQGAAYGYSWFTGMITQSLDGAISRVVKSDDGKKFYMQSPFFLDFYTPNSWIVGDIEDDVLTFTFPQLVEEDIDENDPSYSVYGYAMKLEFIPSEDDPDTGWYYTTPNPEFKFRIEADGTLTSLEEEDTMIGYCIWKEPEAEGEEGKWAWQANGDVITSMKPNTEKVVEVPEGVNFNSWQLITGISSREVEVGVDGDNMYIRGLFNRTGMYDIAVVGKIDGDKVTFAGGQYMGEYWYNLTVAYFLGGSITNVEEDGQTKQIFNIGDEIVFDWDKDNNMLSSEGAFCISSSPTKVIYYVKQDKPIIKLPSENAIVTKLLNPVLSKFYDVDEEYDDDAEIYFDIPTVDADYHILDTDRIFYEVFMDDSLFTFYDDEYELPAGVTEMTEVPYNYESEDTDDFQEYGNKHAFIFHTRGFQSLGLRTLYKNPDGTVVYSDMLYAPGYEGSVSIGTTLREKTVISVCWFDLTGCQVDKPGKGIYIKQMVYSDGSVNSYKIVR